MRERMMETRSIEKEMETDFDNSKKKEEGKLLFEEREWSQIWKSKSDASLKSFLAPLQQMKDHPWENFYFMVTFIHILLFKQMN